MKKVLMYVLLAGLAGALMTGCGNDTSDNAASIETTEEASYQVNQQDEAIDNTEGNSNKENTENVNSDNDSSDEGTGKVLVAYFTVAENTELDAVSSATPMIGDVGAVRFLADVIADKTGADEFSIRTMSKYAADFDTAAEKAKQEGDKNERPELEGYIDDISQYDTIFLGYCAWWYDMPMAIYSFLDEYDLSGKTIIPFAAHEGSQFAGGIEAIREACPDAVVIDDGFSIRGNDISESSRTDIEKWIDGLDF